MINPQVDPTDACVDALSTYLVGKIPTLTVLREWPDANQKLKYPSLTLFQGKTQIMNLPPETISVTDPDVNNQVIATEIIGEADFTLQMDLWCSDKYMRTIYQGLVMDAINAQALDNSGADNPAGLSLELANYFNDWVRFDIDSFETVDDEAGAQRRERRSKIMLLVNCRVIRQRSYYAMKTIQTYVGADTDIALTADVNNTEVSVVAS